MFTSRISAHSSKSVNEFNKEEDEATLVAPPQSPLQKSTSWFIFLCPLVFLLGVLIPSIVIIALATSIDNKLLEENSSLTTDCTDELTKTQINSNFVLFNFISFRALSSINLLLVLVGMALSIGYIFLYYRIRLLKRHVFASEAIPPYLAILSGFVSFFCIVQCSIYWCNSSTIDADVFRSSVIDKSSTCYEAYFKSNGWASLKLSLESQTDSLYGAAVFLFCWALIFLFGWVVCYSIRRFKLKEDIFRRPI